MVEVSPETRFDRMSGRQRTAVIGDVCLALFGRHSGPRLAQARAGEDTYRFDNKIGLRLPMPGFTSPRLTINSLGFRGPELPRKKPPGTYRIAFLGGSTTYCAEVSGDDKT